MRLDESILSQLFYKVLDTISTTSIGLFWQVIIVSKTWIGFSLDKPIENIKY